MAEVKAMERLLEDRHSRTSPGRQVGSELSRANSANALHRGEAITADQKVSKTTESRENAAP